jgi:hypothetical protein
VRFEEKWPTMVQKILTLLLPTGGYKNVRKLILYSKPNKKILLF